MQAKQYNTGIILQHLQNKTVHNDAYLLCIKLSKETFCQQKSGCELCLSWSASVLHLEGEGEESFKLQLIVILFTPIGI